MRIEYIDIFPTELEGDVLYISQKYSTSAHLCASGCGFRVVLPLGKGGWSLVDNQNATLHPSVHVEACNSHYWVRDGGIKWARQFNSEEIAAYAAADQEEFNSELQPKSILSLIGSLLKRLFKHRH